MTTLARAPVPIVVHQHLEDTISLRETRSVLVRAPHIRLHLLRRLDDRLAASLDGLMVAADAGRDACSSALATPGTGVIFAATVGAIHRRDERTLGQLLSITETLPELRAAVTSAYGWVDAASLRGLTKQLLDSALPHHRDIGLAACAMHHVDPGAALEAALVNPTSSTQATIVAGKLGRSALSTHCVAGLKHKDLSHQFESARAAVLLGNRQEAVQTLKAMAAQAGPFQVRALQLVLKVLAADQANALLKPLSQDPASVRVLIRGAGVAGDPVYVPWLIKQMGELQLTRLAGEAFSMITGLDLAYLDLDRKPPEKMEFGPNDDPADADVAMDEDDSLPWPDPDKLAAWWQNHGSRFSSGARYFVGEPPSAAHCLSVLKTGFQRQRIAAAEYLCLLAPGTPLFNTAAPAWRQERLLAHMGAS